MTTAIKWQDSKKSCNTNKYKVKTLNTNTTINEEYTAINSYNMKTQHRTTSTREFMKTKKTGATQTNTTQKNRIMAPIKVCQTTTNN